MWHLEEVDVVLPRLRREEEGGGRVEVLGDGHVDVPQVVPVAERRDLAPLAAVVLRLSSQQKQPLHI